jgi:hypothetical protein
MKSLSYTTVDLINKAIYTTQKKKKLYLNQLENVEGKTLFYVLTSVIMKNLDNSIEHYNELKREIGNDVEEIDFTTYDKISFTINQFNEKMLNPNIINTKDLMNFHLNFEKSLLILYISIKGILVKNKKDVETTAYEVTSDMIIEVEKNIEKLEKFIKNYS